jgi:hypothetical protein
MARAAWLAGWLVRLLHELVHRSSSSSNNYGVFFCLVFLTKPFTASSYNLLQFLGAFFLGGGANF